MSILASREHGVIPKSSTAVLTGGRVIHVRSDETVTVDRGNFGVVTEFKALPFTLLFLLADAWCPPSFAYDRHRCLGKHARTNPSSAGGFWDESIQSGPNSRGVARKHLQGLLGAPGCENVWFHRECMNYDFAPKSWVSLL